MIGGAFVGVIASLSIGLEFVCACAAGAFFITAAILTSGGTANVVHTKTGCALGGLHTAVTHGDNIFNTVALTVAFEFSLTIEIGGAAGFFTEF